MYAPSVWEWALRAILLHMHAEEAHVHAINLLKGKKCFGSVGKSLRHLTCVHKPVVNQKKRKLNSKPSVMSPDNLSSLTGCSNTNTDKKLGASD